MIDALEAAGEDGPAVGLELAAALVEDVRGLPGIAGIHVEWRWAVDEATRGLRDARRAVPPPDHLGSECGCGDANDVAVLRRAYAVVR